MNDQWTAPARLPESVMLPGCRHTRALTWPSNLSGPCLECGAQPIEYARYGYGKHAILGRENVRIKHELALAQARTAELLAEVDRLRVERWGDMAATLPANAS